MCCDSVPSPLFACCACKLVAVSKLRKAKMQILFMLRTPKLQPSLFRSLFDLAVADYSTTLTKVVLEACCGSARRRLGLSSILSFFLVSEPPANLTSAFASIPSLRR